MDHPSILLDYWWYNRKWPCGCPRLASPHSLIPCGCPRLASPHSLTASPHSLAASAHSLTASPHSLTASPQRRKGIQRRWNPIHRGRASFRQRWNANLQRLNPCSTETTFKLKWKAPKILRGWIPSCSLGTLDCSLNLQSFIEWLQCQRAVKAILHGRILSLHRVIAKLQAGDTSLRPWKASLQWK